MNHSGMKIALEKIRVPREIRTLARDPFGTKHPHSIIPWEQEQKPLVNAFVPRVGFEPTFLR